jgi:hypothetical protein
MAFYLADMQQQSYHELMDHINAAARAKGWAEVIEDVFCFQMRAVAINTEDTPIYQASQVWADKLTGSGEGINSGQRVYATLGSLFQSVTANPAGVIGTDFYFCGWAKRNADPDDERVLIRFWGHEHDHADRA